MKSYTRRQSKTIVVRLLLAVTILVALQTQSQAQNDSLKQRYQQLSKSQKAGGFVMLGMGLTCFILQPIVTKPVETSLRIMVSPLTGETVEQKKGTGFIVAGLVFVAASIPLFLAAGKNKRKAASISVSSTSWQRLQGNSIATNYQPCLKLNVSF